MIFPIPPLAWANHRIRRMERQSKNSESHQEKMRTLDDDEADCLRLGISHRFMHISALSPSTRISHAERHGRLFTADEIRQWMVEGDNAISCQCTFTLVLVDENGSPRMTSLLVRAAVARQKFFAARARDDISS